MTTDRIACDFLLRGAGERVTTTCPARRGELVTMSRREDCGVLTRRRAGGEGRPHRLGRRRGASWRTPSSVTDDGVVVDADGVSVLPGFVDAHTHTVFAGERAYEYAERLGGVTLPRDPRRRRGHQRDGARDPRGVARRARVPRPPRFDASCATARRRSRPRPATASRSRPRRSSSRRRGSSIRCAACTTVLAAHFVPPEFAGRDDDYVDLVCDEILPALPGAAPTSATSSATRAPSRSRRRGACFERGRGLGYRLKIHAEELAHTGGARLAAEFGCVSADHLITPPATTSPRCAPPASSPSLLPGTCYTLHCRLRAGARLPRRRRHARAGDRLQPRHLLLREHADGDLARLPGGCA